LHNGIVQNGILQNGILQNGIVQNGIFQNAIELTGMHKQIVTGSESTDLQAKPPSPRER
jgi:hypothetical protein